jgi:hypothetical protein
MVNARPRRVKRAGHAAIERRRPSKIGDDEGRSGNEREPWFDGCGDPHEPSSFMTAWTLAPWPCYKRESTAGAPGPASTNRFASTLLV